VERKAYNRDMRFFNICSGSIVDWGKEEKVPYVMTEETEIHFLKQKLAGELERDIKENTEDWESKLAHSSIHYGGVNYTTWSNKSTGAIFNLYANSSYPGGYWDKENGAHIRINEVMIEHEYCKQIFKYIDKIMKDKRDKIRIKNESEWRKAEKTRINNFLQEFYSTNHITNA